MTVLCRTCCKNINTDEEAFALDTVPNESNNKEPLNRILRNLLPTVNLDSVQQPVVCNYCYATVVNFHNFKRDCLKNEATLRNYIRNNQIKTKIHLAEIFSTNCPPIKDDQPVVKIEEGEIMVKEEPEVVGGSSENEVEHVELIPDDEDNVNNLLHEQCGIGWTSDKEKLAGNKCNYYQCGRSRRVEPSLRNFAFPVNDKERYRIWLINSGNAQLLGVDPKKTTRMHICHYHFDKKYFLNKRLAPTAIPEPCFALIANEKEQLECVECQQKFDTSNEIARHIKHAHGSIRCIACKLCTKFFVSQDAFKLHLAVHKTDKKYGCKRCGKMFDSLASMQIHRLIHSKYIACSICKVRMLNHKSFSRHYRTKHANPQNRYNICKYCDGNFSSFNHLLIHIKAFHEPDKKLEKKHYLCDVCGKVFETNRMLLSHKQMHKERNMQCTVCLRKFHTKRQLEKHLSVHDRKKSYKCTECQAIFNMKAFFIRHLNKVHNTGPRPKCKLDKVEVKSPA